MHVCACAQMHESGDKEVTVRCSHFGNRVLPGFCCVPEKNNNTAVSRAFHSQFVPIYLNESYSDTQMFFQFEYSIIEHDCTANTVDVSFCLSLVYYCSCVGVQHKCLYTHTHVYNILQTSAPCSCCALLSACVISHKAPTCDIKHSSTDWKALRVMM